MRVNPQRGNALRPPRSDKRFRRPETGRRGLAGAGSNEATLACDVGRARTQRVGQVCRRLCMPACCVEHGSKTRPLNSQALCDVYILARLQLSLPEGTARHQSARVLHSTHTKQRAIIVATTESVTMRCSVVKQYDGRLPSACPLCTSGVVVLADTKRAAAHG